MKKNKTKEQKKTDDKQFIFKNYHIDTFFKLLVTLKLKPDMARVRNRVVDIIAKKDEEFKKNNEALLKLYGKKGKDGKVIISEQDGRTTVQLSNVQKYADEYKKLLDEDVIIDLLPSNTSDFKAMKVILSKLDVEMDYTDTKILDELLERFNLIK